MPLAVKTTGLTMLLLFVGFFGAAVSTAKTRSDGRAMQLRILPIPRILVMLDRAWAGGVIDLLQIGPLIAFLLVVEGTGYDPSVWGPVFGYACATLLLLNILGHLLGAAVEGNAEIHLAGALAVGMIAFLSGLMPAPDLLKPVVASTSAWSPVFALKAAMDGACADASGSGTAVLSVSGGYLGLAALLFPALLRLCDLPGEGFGRPAGPR